RQVAGDLRPERARRGEVARPPRLDRAAPRAGPACPALVEGVGSRRRRAGALHPHPRRRAGRARSDEPRGARRAARDRRVDALAGRARRRRLQGRLHRADAERRGARRRRRQLGHRASARAARDRLRRGEGGEAGRARDDAYAASRVRRRHRHDPPERHDQRADRPADAPPRRGRTRRVPGAADRHRRLARARQALVARVPRAEARARRAVALLRDAHRHGRGAERRRLRRDPPCVGRMARQRAEARRSAPRSGGVTARPITLADVAREAGTSASTASRALSGRGYVAPEVRARLLRVADRLGYVPNLSARTLKQRTSRVVGVVVSDLSNQFYAALAAGVEQALRAANYQMLLLGDNSEAAQELAGARAFLAMRAPGVIMTPASRAAADLLVARGLAVVEVDRRISTSCDAVVIDNERGAREAVTHLLELGHTRIALLVARTTWTTDAGRLDGYRM